MPVRHTRVLVLVHKSKTDRFTIRSFFENNESSDLKAVGCITHALLRSLIEVMTAAELLKLDL